MNSRYSLFLTFTPLFCLLLLFFLLFSFTSLPVLRNLSCPCPEIRVRVRVRVRVHRTLCYCCSHRLSVPSPPIDFLIPIPSNRLPHPHLHSRFPIY
ncbi:hypothetical protein V8D89_009374, partial [Ganoderma adspersum]